MIVMSFRVFMRLRNEPNEALYPPPAEARLSETKIFIVSILHIIAVISIFPVWSVFPHLQVAFLLYRPCCVTLILEGTFEDNCCMRYWRVQS